MDLLGNPDPSDSGGFLLGGGNPNAMPLLGLIAGLGQGSAPSRLPVPTGMVIGNAAQGYMQGMQAGARQRMTQAQADLLSNQVLGQQAMRSYLLGNNQSPTASPSPASAPAPSVPSAPSPSAPSLGAQPPAISPDAYVATVKAGENNTGNPGAQNPNSSAAGDGQFINSTWLNLVKANRPDLAQGKSDDQILALRSDPQLSSQMIQQYAVENAPKLAAAGFPTTAANLGLAHRFGPDGAASILGADPNAPIQSIVSPQVMAANPDLKGETAGSVQQSFNTRFGMRSVGAQPPVLGNAAPQQNVLGNPQPNPPPLIDPRMAAQIGRVGLAYGVPGAAEMLKFAEAPSGYQYNASGNQNAVTGGPADPAILGRNKLTETLAGNEQILGPNGQVQPMLGSVESAAAKAGGISGAQAAATTPYDVYKASMAPHTLRGPGSVYVNPATNQVVQIPNEINQIDPVTGAEYKAFVPLGLKFGTFSGGGAAAPGQPQSSPQQGASAPNPATPVQNGAPAADESRTSFLTALPPGQKELIEGAAKNYADEGKKTYQSAVAGLSSIAMIDRDIDQLGPSGWTAMGSGANDRIGLMKTINSAANMAGAGNVFDPNKVASWEDFQKETTLLGMKGLASIFGGSREAASIITTSIHAVPNTENTFVGGKLLTNAYKEAFQREVDLRNYETNWAGTHGGNLVGAQESFNQQFAPQGYSYRAISKVQPYTVTSPADMQQFLPGTYIKTPDGQTRVVPGNPSVQLSQPNG